MTFAEGGLARLTHHGLVLPDWRGYRPAWLALTAVANNYHSAHARQRMEIRRSAEVGRLRRERRASQASAG